MRAVQRTAVIPHTLRSFLSASFRKVALRDSCLLFVSTINRSCRVINDSISPNPPRLSFCIVRTIVDGFNFGGRADLRAIVIIRGLAGRHRRLSPTPSLQIAGSSMPARSLAPRSASRIPLITDAHLLLRNHDVPALNGDAAFRASQFLALVRKASWVGEQVICQSFWPS